MRKLFGTDGIRAVAGEAPLDKRTIYAVGVALATKLAEKHKPVRIILGMDTRESGPWIAATLTAGLTATGADRQQHRSADAGRPRHQHHGTRSFRTVQNFTRKPTMTVTCVSLPEVPTVVPTKPLARPSVTSE